MIIKNEEDFIKAIAESTNEILEFEYEGESYKFNIMHIANLKKLTFMNDTDLFNFCIRMKSIWIKWVTYKLPICYNGNVGIEHVGASFVSGIPRYKRNPKILHDSVGIPELNLPKYTTGPKLAPGILFVLYLSTLFPFK